MACVHGDWHTLQLVAEILRDMLWDGGLKQLAHDCGQKKIPTQWQDLHLLLLALYEALMRGALLEYSNIAEPNFAAFTDWMQSAGSQDNNNDISKFWTSVIKYLNAYYYWVLLLN